MKTYNIAVLIENKVTDVISYQSERRDLEKEKTLVIKFMKSQVCTIKSIEQISAHRLTIVSDKIMFYHVTWKTITIWDESELED